MGAFEESQARLDAQHQQEMHERQRYREAGELAEARARASGGGCFGGIFAMLILVGIVAAIVLSYRGSSSGDSGPATAAIFGPQASASAWAGTYECDDGDLSVVLALELGVREGRSRAARVDIGYATTDAQPIEGLGGHALIGSLEGARLRVAATDDAPSEPRTARAIDATISEAGTVILGEVLSDACSALGVRRS